RSLAGRAVEGEGRSRRDELVVDEMCDELNVVNAVRDPAVDRLEAADGAGDAHGLGLSRRELWLRLDEGEPGDAVGRPRRGGEDAGGGLQHVERASGPGRRDVHGALRGRDEVGVARRGVDLALETSEVPVRVVTGEPHRAKVEELREPPAREAVTRRAREERDRCGDDVRRGALV